MEDKKASKTMPKQSAREKEIINLVNERMFSAENIRRKSERYFNDRDLVEYVNSSVDNFNGYVQPRSEEEAGPNFEWESKVFNDVTRRKTIAVVSQVSAELTKAEFFATSPDDPEQQAIARIAKSANHHAGYINKDHRQNFFVAFEAAVKGTYVGVETYMRSSRFVNEVTDFDPETGKIEYKKKEVTEWDDVYSGRVPLLDIYPGNQYEFDIQKQPWIIWRTVMLESDFQTEFGKYPNAKFVTGGSAGNIIIDDKYKEVLTNSITDQQVEVIRYFNRFTDEMHFVANRSILLTPLVSPFPWNHKKYPFYKVVFEPLAADFFYGKSLPDKLRNDQEVLNTLYRMMLDQTFLSIHKPIFSSSVEELQDRYLYPGAQIKVDDITQYKEFEISSPNSSQFSMLQYVEETMNKTSIDDATQGISGSNSTAFEVSIANESAKKVLNTFLRSLEWGTQDKIDLRLKNQFQFYQIPQVKDWANDKEEELFTKVRTIIARNQKLSNGTTGTHVVNIVEDEENLPSADTINNMEDQAAQQGKNVAYTYLTTEALNKFDVMVHIIPNSSLQMSEALKRALEIDYQDKVTKLYPDLLNRQEGFRELNEVYDKDSEKLIMPPPPPQAAPGTDQSGGQGAGQGGMTPDQMQQAATPPGGDQPASPPNVPMNPSTAPSGEAAMGSNEMMNSPRNVVQSAQSYA